jgi:protein SCO1/2
MSASSRPRAFALVVFSATFLVSFALLGFFVVRPLLTRSASGRAAELPRLGQVPAFALPAHDGGTLTESALRGNVWIADFVFLRCGTTCPLMTASMASLGRTLADAPSIRFVSFDVDPDHDTVAGLADYAKENGASAPRWTFVHGKDRATIRAISREGFHLGLDDGDASDSEPILHSSRFVLVDTEGAIRGTYDGTDSAALETLARDARRLQKGR